MPRDPRGRRAYPVDVEEQALQRVELRGGDGEQARVAVQRGAGGTDIRVVRIRGEVEEGWDWELFLSNVRFGSSVVPGLPEPSFVNYKTMLAIFAFLSSPIIDKPNSSDTSVPRPTHTFVREFTYWCHATVDVEVACGAVAYTYTPLFDQGDFGTPRGEVHSVC